MYVQVKGDSQKELDLALRKFTKMIKDSGLMDTLKKKEHYVKKSVRLRIKQNDAKRQRIRDQKKLEKRKINKDI